VTPDRRAMVTALAGALCISTSAIVMTEAGSSASVLALGRSGFALPVLGALLWLERRREGRSGGDRSPRGNRATRMTSRSVWLARTAGVFLAADLILWAHSIDEIGAGLSTVLSNLQVIIVAGVGWLVLGEKPRRSLLVAAPAMVLGLLLVGGVLTGGGYGADPGLGVVYGIGVGVFYSVYILLLRQAAQGAGGSAVQTLFEATLGATVGAAVLGAALRDFRLGPAWPALGWLVVLALTSGVLGWLLLTISMPRLPAWLASSLLLVQPAGSIVLGAVFLRQDPAPAQLAGVVVMLGGVLVATRGAGGGASKASAPETGPQETSVPETSAHESRAGETVATEESIVTELGRGISASWAETVFLTR
jgi:drug/metabolite transporter (DMT)-like permease